MTEYIPMVFFRLLGGFAGNKLRHDAFQDSQSIQFYYSVSGTAKLEQPEQFFTHTFAGNIRMQWLYCFISDIVFSSI
jgi:hypothetical protein